MEGIGTPDMSEMQELWGEEAREAARTTQLPNWWGWMTDGLGRCAPRMESRDLCRACPGARVRWDDVAMDSVDSEQQRQILGDIQHPPGRVVMGLMQCSAFTAAQLLFMRGGARYGLACLLFPPGVAPPKVPARSSSLTISRSRLCPRKQTPPHHCTKPPQLFHHCYLRTSTTPETRFIACESCGLTSLIYPRIRHVVHRTHQGAGAGPRARNRKGARGGVNSRGGASRWQRRACEWLSPGRD
jgi:hypothetical protein